MLSEHRIDIQSSANIFRRIDSADFDKGAVISSVHLAHILATYRKDFASRRWITRDAASEVIDFPGQSFFVTLSQKVESYADRWERLSSLHSKRLDTIRELAQPGQDGNYNVSYLTAAIRKAVVR